MNILIYPDPNKLKLNINEEMISQPIFINKLTYYKDSEITTLQEKFGKIIPNIKSIFIFKDNYGIFIERNIDFILNNKTIRFYILQNDLHFNRESAYKRNLLLRSNLLNNNHIYILSYYWYFFTKLYKINNNNLICYPKFIVNNNIKKINTNPKMEILLSGASSKSYPIRKYLSSINHPKVKILKHSDNIFGDNFYNHMNQFIACFTCCSNKNTPYIIRKFFEIPATGSLLLAYDEFVKEPLKEIGFIPDVNYISCNKKNLIQKIEWICNKKNINKVNEIRKNGQELVIHQHTIKSRFILIESLIK